MIEFRDDSQLVSEGSVNAQSNDLPSQQLLNSEPLTSPANVPLTSGASSDPLIRGDDPPCNDSDPLIRGGDPLCNGGDPLTSSALCNGVTRGDVTASVTNSTSKDGCFSSALLRDRDDLSSTGESADVDERRGKLAPPLPLPLYHTHPCLVCR